MKITVLLSIAALLLGTVNLAAASDSLRSRSSSIIEEDAPPTDVSNVIEVEVEDAMVTMLRVAIENEDPKELFGSDFWDGFKQKLCYDFKKKDAEEEEKTLAGTFLLLFKLRKLLCEEDGITTSTTSTTSTTPTCENPPAGCGVVNSDGTISVGCCPGRFVFVLLNTESIFLNIQYPSYISLCLLYSS